MRAQGPLDGPERRRLPVARAARPHRARLRLGCSARPTGSGCASSAATRCSFAAGSSASGASWRPSSTTSAGSSPARSTRPSSCPPPIARSEELEGFLEHLCREIHDPGLRGVVERLVLSGPQAGEFRRAPCTRGGHHAYLGGLLEHTVSVGTLVGELCQLHPRLDSDLLMAAALLHDVGKTREFTYGAEFGISDEGRLLGHLAIGAQMVARRGGRAARRAPAGAPSLRALAPRRGSRPGRARRAAAGSAGLRLRRGAGALPAERPRRLGQGRPGARALAPDRVPVEARARTSWAAITRARAANRSSRVRSETSFEITTPTATPSGERAPTSRPSRTLTFP